MPALDLRKATTEVYDERTGIVRPTECLARLVGSRSPPAQSGGLTVVRRRAEAASPGAQPENSCKCPLFGPSRLGRRRHERPPHRGVLPHERQFFSNRSR